MASITSVDLSITITAAVPSPDWRLVGWRGRGVRVRVYLAHQGMVRLCITAAVPSPDWRWGEVAGEGVSVCVFGCALVHHDHGGGAQPRLVVRGEGAGDRALAFTGCV